LCVTIDTACAITANGVSCWGASFSAPTELIYLTVPKSVACGWEHVCILRSDRTVVCSGYCNILCLCMRISHRNLKQVRFSGAARDRGKPSEHIILTREWTERRARNCIRVFAYMCHYGFHRGMPVLGTKWVWAAGNRHNFK
jgi:hypothetical protein